MANFECKDSGGTSLGSNICNVKQVNTDGTVTNSNAVAQEFLQVIATANSGAERLFLRSLDGLSDNVEANGSKYAIAGSEGKTSTYKLLETLTDKLTNAEVYLVVKQVSVSVVETFLE